MDTENKLSILIVQSQYNDLITERLLSGARTKLLNHGILATQLSTVSVAGVFELPLAVKWGADAGAYDGMIVLGCVIAGETQHNDYISRHVISGIGRISVETGIPVTLGVVTTNTMEQALARAGGKQGNKGAEAAMALLDLIRLRHVMSSGKS